VQASALERAAELLGNARLPVIGGLQTDIAGAKAALALAEKLGGVIDHAAGEGLARQTKIMRETGGCPASLGEARNRADIIVLVGKAPLERDPGLLRELFPTEQGLPRPGNNPRELVLLGCDKTDVPVTPVGLGNKDLPTLIAMLGAAVAGHRLGAEDRALGTALGSVAERLRAASFAVFVYSPADLDEPVLHTILDMVRHLCVTTRAANLPLPAPGNGDGVNLCSAWTCGLPVRTSFAQPVPEHDAWLNATRRLIESGEADALLWIDALPTRGSERPEGVPTIVLASSGNAVHAGAEIVIDVACPGRDYDAALYVPQISGIGMVKAAKPRKGVSTVAEVLTGITELVARREGGSC
jgi:formylmethanofuran dehydrogenase subunit B